ncbi:protein STPG4 isoform X2 [Crotalus tigris]|uniref:protein STPG4 isoform X2 n=1 Tax=Crotalus tigris TaxID=88082 RepID=UPI00192FB56E|nr:protein STPG4 isoform X2 [Crotalus tigris]
MVGSILGSKSSKHSIVGEHEKIPYQRRDTWWRESLRPTPIPGFYPVRGFLEEAQLNPVKATYNFKGEGRKRASIYEQLPDLTLQNAFKYYPPSFVELAEKRPATYSFKSTSRQSNYPINRDKNINTDPGQYDLFPHPVPTFPTKSYMFRSAVQRHPIFPLKQGPGPGEYEIKDVQPVPIRSSFISKIPRILPAHTVSIILKMAQTVLAAIGLTWGSCLSWRHSIFSLWICSFLFWVGGGGNLVFSRYKGKHGDSKCYLDSGIIKLHPWK